MSMMRLIADAARLSRRERALAARAGAWVLLARLALRVAPFGAVRGTLQRIPGRRGPGATAAECARAIQRASRALPSSRCLALACAGAALLRRERHDAVLTIHVNVADGQQFEAHASLASDGVIVVGDGSGASWPVLLTERIPS